VFLDQFDYVNDFVSFANVYINNSISSLLILII